MSDLQSKFNLRTFLVVTAVLFVGTFVTGPSRVVAQGTTATILGTVTDPSGAVIADATVQVTNTGTGNVHSVTTDPQGRYSVSNLDIGDYEVQVSKAGFNATVHKGITLSVGSQSVVDVALLVGAQTQTVTVEAQAVQVETTNSSISQLVDPKQMRDLPLNGRDFEQLIQLAPGITTVNASSINARQGNATAASYSGPGARIEGAAILLDDEDMASWYKRGMSTISGSALGVESMAEFTVLTNTYSAQYSGNLVVVNSVSRSGTNSMHGTVYGFFRNSVMDARNFFDGPTVPPFQRNQYGASLGGPIKKDKLFYFVNYEGLRLALGKTQIATVPDANHRTPAASVTDPAERAAIVNVMALYPLPTFNLNPVLGTGQVNEVATQNGVENYALMRMDYHISSRDSIFARYTLDRQTLTNPFTSSAIPLWPEEDVGGNDFFTTEWNRIISSSVINTARFSLSRPSYVTTEQQPGFPTTPVLQFFPAAPDRTMGVVGISGLTGVGMTAFVPARQFQTKIAGSEDLLWTHGSHTLRFGGSVTRVRSNSFYPHTGGGSFSFNNLTNFLAGTASSVSGIPLSPMNNPNWGFRETDTAVYVQDDWKAARRLTLNLGVRYEPYSNPVDVHNHLYNIVDFVNGTGYVNTPHLTATNPNWKNIDPRIGFAYDVFADHKTSLRAGFTLNHNPFFPGNYSSAFNNNPPWRLLQLTGNSCPCTFPAAIATLDTSNALPSGAPSWYYFNNRVPYMMAYNLNIQRQLFGTVLSVGYVGSSGVNLETGQEKNPYTFTLDPNGVYHFASLQTVGGKPTIVANPRQDPFLGTMPAGVTGANSRYNSLQVTVNRRFSGILQAQVAYTFAKCIDDGGLYLGPLNPTGGGTFENPYNREVDRGRCEADVRQNARINAIVSLPFKGSRFVQGWQLAGIETIQSGIPFNATDGYDVACNSTCAPRPNYLAGCNPQANPTVAQWFNPACFPLEPVGTLGNSGRDILTGPNLRQLDMSLTKDTNITEAYRVQFRAEVFNILNRPNFGLPTFSLYSAGAVAGTGVLNQSAGQITSTIPSSTSRQIQLGVKFIF